MKAQNRLFAAAVVLLLSTPLPAAECDRTFAEIFDDVSDSVVQIYAVSIDPFSLMHRVQHAVGTGFVVDEDGHVVTNAHLVYGASTIMVATSSDDMLPAEMVGVDPLSDLAVVQLSVPGGALPKAALGSSAELRIGEEVLAVGYPFGIGKTATRGIVSGMERVMPFSPSSWMTPLIQTDAAINPGNSGGPLVDRCGTVIAVNTIGSSAGQNVNFSIPIDTVVEYLPQLIERGRIVRPWHGINGAIVPMPMVFSFGIPPGYIIETIEPGSPAEKIGLRGGNFPVIIGNNEFLLGGDVISEVNGVELNDMDTVFEIARSLEVGDTISIKYYRDGFLQTAEVELPERPILPGDTRRFMAHNHPQ
jgi:serine protease Do